MMARHKKAPVRGLKCLTGGSGQMYLTCATKKERGNNLIKVTLIVNSRHKTSQTDKNCHIPSNRRSFNAAGKSCDTNLTPPGTRKLNRQVAPSSTIRPMRAGINSVLLKVEGVVLRAIVKSLLMTGWYWTIGSFWRGSTTALIRPPVFIGKGGVYV